MRRWFTADFHVIHPNIIKYAKRPQLKPGDLNEDGSWVSYEIAHLRAEQMNTMLIREANQRVHADDTVIHVGDFACRGGEKGFMGEKTHPKTILDQLNGNWVLIKGNHDECNSVKTVANFMSCEIAKYRVGVQHRPLQDEEAYLKWKALSPAEKAANPWRDRMSDQWREHEFIHASYCRRMFDFMICGHVHNAWKVKKVAGIWHVNVGVDVNRYMPIDDQEVVQIYEKAVKGV
jgi:calcineurin-like phosphoesterase family protein